MYTELSYAIISTLFPLFNVSIFLTLSTCIQFAEYVDQQL